MLQGLSLVLVDSLWTGLQTMLSAVSLETVIKNVANGLFRSFLWSKKSQESPRANVDSVGLESPSTLEGEGRQWPCKARYVLYV